MYYHPCMWVCKPHYYFANTNFYNFPYAFGQLFGKGLFAEFLKHGDKFVKEYDTLLSVTWPRDFYDIYILNALRISECKLEVLKLALEETSKKRGSFDILSQYKSIVDSIKSSPAMRDFWARYQKEFDYAKDVSFEDACNTILKIMSSLGYVNYSYKI